MLVFEKELFLNYWYIFLAIFLVYCIGILDDHKDAPPKAKFVIIVVGVILLFMYDIKIDNVGIYFGTVIPLWYFALPFSIFAITGFTNALNLIDGLDGLAVSISIVILSAFAYIGIVFHDELIIKPLFIFYISTFSIYTI